MAVFTPTSSADWINPSHAELVQLSPMIVTGEIIGRDLIQIDENAQITLLATLKIDEVIKGDKHQRIAYLRLPNHPHGLVSSTDVPLKDGQIGLWYLHQIQQGLYEINRPYRFFPPEKMKQQLEELKDLGFSLKD